MSIAPSLFGQRLWQCSVTEQDYAYVGSDTSVERLRQLILDTTNDDDHIARNAAIDILACSGGESQKDFLLSTLQMAAPVDSLGSASPSWVKWSDYMNYQFARGFYGDGGAITGMDSIARFAPDSTMKLLAIAQLAEAGVFEPEYFTVLQTAFARGLDFVFSMNIIAAYGTDQRYRAEAGDLLEPVVRDSSLAVARSAARYLAKFDRPRATSLMEARFESSPSDDRYLCFVTLGRIDSSGQARRSMWAIPREIALFPSLRRI